MPMPVVAVHGQAAVVLGAATAAVVAVDAAAVAALGREHLRRRDGITGTVLQLDAT